MLDQGLRVLEEKDLDSAGGSGVFKEHQCRLINNPLPEGLYILIWHDMGRFMMVYESTVYGNSW